jgi:hypothetical protein
VDEEALAHWGLADQKQTKKQGHLINSRNMDTFQTSLCVFVQAAIECRYAAHWVKLTHIDLKRNHTVM